MTDVFVSYSRADSGFVRELHAFLGSSGRNVWVDWEDIPAASEWERDIYDNIDGAESFVFVVSTSSLASEYCTTEFRHAQERGKRIVPIACDAADPAAAPLGLRQLNWIWCREGDDRDAAFAKLSSALDTDLEWARAHTRLLVRAVDWDTRQDSSLLLRGRDLKLAEQDLAANAAKEPVPTELQQRYVLASRRAASRRQRLMLGAVTVALLVSLALAVVAWQQRNTANDRAQIARSQGLAAQSLHVQSLDPRRGLALAARAEDTSATPQAEEALRTGLVAVPHPVALVAPGSTTYGVDFDPKARFVATAGEGGAFVQSTAGELVKTLVPQKLVYSARFSPDGRFLVTADADGAIRLWRVGDWRELPSRARIRPHLRARAAFSADGRFLVAGGHPGWNNRVWRFRDGRSDRGSPRATASAAGSTPTGRRGSSPPAPKPGRAGSRERRRTPSARVRTAASSSSRRQGGAARVFRTAALRLLRTLPPAAGAVFAPNGLRLATEGGRTTVWDVARNRPVAVLAGTLAGGAFSRDGTLLVTVSRARALARVWDVRSGRLVAELPPHPPRFYATVDLPDPYPNPDAAAPGTRGRRVPAPACGPDSRVQAPALGRLLAQRRPRRDLGQEAQGCTAVAAARHAPPRRPPHGLRAPRRAAAASCSRQPRRSARRGGRPQRRGGDLGALVQPNGPPSSAAAPASSRRWPSTRKATSWPPAASTATSASGAWPTAGFSTRSRDTAAGSAASLSALTARGSRAQARTEPCASGTCAPASSSPSFPLATGQPMRSRSARTATRSLPRAATGLPVSGRRGAGSRRPCSSRPASERRSCGLPSTATRASSRRSTPTGSRACGPVAEASRFASRRTWGASPSAPTGSQLAVGGGDATARILPTDGGTDVGVLRGHTNIVSDARFGEGDRSSPPGSTGPPASGRLRRRARWQASDRAPRRSSTRCSSPTAASSPSATTASASMPASPASAGPAPGRGDGSPRVACHR